MKYGLYMPNYGKVFGYAKNLAEVAKEAESAGWDGFFIWDHMLAEKPFRHPFVDPWVGLTATAMNTDKIHIGTTVTPIPRRRPWKLARETVSIDQLSNGRLILSIGLGTPSELEYGAFGEETDVKIRAEMLDEGLDVLFGLWSGKPFSYQGKHYQIDDVKFIPKPVQKPRIKIWGSGFWPNKKPAIRAARLDGFFPLKMRSHGSFTFQDYKEINDLLNQHRTLDTPFDIVKLQRIVSSDQKKVKEQIEKLEQVGITWLMNYLGAGAKFESILERIRQGPPVKK